MNQSKDLKMNSSVLIFSERIQFGLGSASDFYGFDQLVGSSNLDTQYDYNPKEHGNILSHPLYHTSYETFSAVKKFIDPDFSVRRCNSYPFRLNQSSFNVVHLGTSIDVSICRCYRSDVVRKTFVTFENHSLRWCSSNYNEEVTTEQSTIRLVKSAKNSKRIYSKN